MEGGRVKITLCFPEAEFEYVGVYPAQGGEFDHKRAADGVRRKGREGGGEGWKEGGICVSWELCVRV